MHISTQTHTLTHSLGFILYSAIYSTFKLFFTNSFRSLINYIFFIEREREKKIAMFVSTDRNVVATLT
jgi:hypothetical protein